MHMIGNKLGPYEIKEEVGKGGMATVYRAYQPNMDRDVAVKVILKSQDRNEESVQRFQREARLIARLEHAHILPVYDFDGGHEPPYIVMRYLDGGTLKNVLKQGMLPLEEVSYLIRQVGSALDYAHRQGIIHRDIKPSNILVDREGNTFVTDFGIARMVSGAENDEQITRTGVIVGTPDYMAPEQVMGAAEVDHRADIYALGIILFQMLIGELPFSAESPAGLLIQHLQADIPSVAAIDERLPKSVDEIIARALAKEPDDRFSSTMALVEALTAEIGGTVGSRPAQLRQAAGESVILRRLVPEFSDTGSSKTPSEQNKSITALNANAAEFAEVIDDYLGTETARQILLDLLNKTGELVNENGGVVISRTEDTMFAVWGAEVSREDDTERAIRAGLEMQIAASRQSAKYLSGEAEEGLAMDIGVNSGLALVAQGNKPGEFTASGMTIRIAQRVMQQALGSLLITHETFNQVRGVFTIEPDSALRVRRNQDPVPIYRVVSAKPRAFRMNTRGIEGVETEMVGRESELKFLQNAFLNTVEEEETIIVTVVSDAGLGKSRLLYEFVNFSELRSETFWLLRGRATPEMTRRPYALLRDLLSFRYEILDSDSPEIVGRKLEAGIEDQIGPDQEMAHLLGHLAGFDLSESDHVRRLVDDPKQLTDRGKQLFAHWIERLCDQNPLVMELEDLHNADEATLNLLNDLIVEHDDLPLMIIGLARPILFQRRANWGSGLPYHSRMDLKPLDKWESRRLVREILKNVAEVPREFRDLLVERAEGNPYYLEELIKTLLDDHVIVRDSDEEWRVELERMGLIEVPATLTGLLQARVDSLLYPEMLTLQRAAVIGRIFYDSALSALDEADETHLDDLPSILKRLTEREFIFVRETTSFEGSVEYIFSGQMLRDMLLSTLLDRQRRIYYKAVAEWIIDASGDRVDEYNSTIADYFEQSGDNATAAEYLGAAGDRALNISAYEDARVLFDHALTLIPSDDPQSIASEIRLGQTFSLLGNVATAREVLSSAVDSAKANKAVQLEAEALYWLSQVAIKEGQYGEAHQFLEDSLLLVRDSDGSVTLARVLYGLGDLNWRLNRLDDSLSHLEQSLALAKEIGNSQIELAAMNRLGVVAENRGDINLARELLEQTLARAQELGNRAMAATVLNNLAAHRASFDDGIPEIEYYLKALNIARETGDKPALAVYLNNIAETYIVKGEIDSAVPYLAEALSVNIRRGLTPSILFSAHLAGWMKIISGDKDRGLALLGLTYYHPAGGTILKRNVQEKLAFVGLEVDDPEVIGALERGKELNLDNVAGELMDELSKKLT